MRTIFLNDSADLMWAQLSLFASNINALLVGLSNALDRDNISSLSKPPTEDKKNHSTIVKIAAAKRKKIFSVICNFNHEDGWRLNYYSKKSSWNQGKGKNKPKLSNQIVFSRWMFIAFGNWFSECAMFNVRNRHLFVCMFWLRLLTTHLCNSAIPLPTVESCWCQ